MYASVATLLVALTTSVSGISDDAAGAQGDAGQQVSHQVAPEPVPIPEPIDDPMDPLVWAIADFAAYTSADPDDVEVVLNQNVTWPDASLGCPEPGRMYLPIQVDGYLIVLHAARDVATYHGAHDELPFRCDREGSLQSPGTFR